MIKPYLRDLINDHKPTTESDNEENEENEENDSDADRAEWKIQLVIQKSQISTKNFEETCTIYLASEPEEIFMGSDPAGKYWSPGRPEGTSPLASPGCPLKILFDRPGEVPI